MNLLLVALLLATQAPGAQDTVAQVLLRLEDDWTVGLTHRDAALFRRLLADGFIYTEDDRTRSEEHTSELQSPCNLVCRLLLEKKNCASHHSTAGRRPATSTTPADLRPT